MHYAKILKQSFDPYFAAPIEAWEQFAHYCEPITFKKNEIIKASDKTEQYFYFILNGSAGIFLWKENNSVCLDFAFDHQFCCDYMSLLLKQPTPLEVMALEVSQMLRIKAEDFYALSKLPVGQVIVQISAEQSFVEKQTQQIELLTCTAEERYLKLRNKFPKIDQRVSQKHIASYLGITPQSLSRLRNAKI